MRAGERAGDAPQPLWPDPGTTRPLASAPRVRRRRTQLRSGVLLRGALVAVVLLVAVLGLGFWRLSATVTNYAGAHFNRGQNAVWLEHSWSGEAHKAVDYDELAARLRREQIAYVFAHVGPLSSDGTIPATRAPEAAALAQALHSRLPGVRVLAWIGQVEAAGGYPASESVDLSQSAVRARISQTAAHFVAGLGFDGVHFDIEPIVNNNPHFLDLLTETRAALPPGAILSVVGQKWAPNAHAAEFLRNAGRGSAWWTSYYYAAVAAQVDQVVAMIYDTGMPLPQLYQLTVQQETAHILDAVRSARHPPQVLIGLPTYAGNSLWFHASAENMETGLTGVVSGLNSNTDTSAFGGVAIYRYGVTSAADWATYERLWLGR